jgi:pimeloyl-ACP methyl ester carboxylesterase
MIDLPSGPASIADIGEGPPALFVHGVFLNGLLWRNVIERVHDIRRCIAVDLPGHGHTPPGPDRDLSLSGLAQMLTELCDALQLATVDLVANDTGGAVSQVFVARDPSRVRSLTLTNCDAHDNVPPAEFKDTAALAGTGQLANGLAGLAGDFAAARAILLDAGYENPDGVPDDIVAEYVRPLAPDENTGRELERFVAAIKPDDLLAVEDTLRSIRVPTLIVWGTGDRFFGPEWAYWLRDLFSADGVIEIPDAKLWFPDEHADALASVLRDFWSRQ